MIKPDKHTDLATSVLNVAGDIIKVLKKNKIARFDEVLTKITNERGKDVKPAFLLSLSFLYLTGKLKYHKNEDLIEFI